MSSARETLPSTAARLLGLALYPVAQVNADRLAPGACVQVLGGPRIHIARSSP